MAGAEGSGQTDLLSGWSCVVHRPSEDPEPSELPSTVDMAAFSSGLTVEPTQTQNDVESCDSESDSDSDSNNSGTDVSGSCSQSDSSDSESSSSSQGSSTRSSSPEFSVMSSQTNGLRLKIATVRKSCSSPNEKPKVSNESKTDDKSAPVNSLKSSNLSSSSESRCSKSSSDSSSDSELDKSDNFENKANDKLESAKKCVGKVKVKEASKKMDKKVKPAEISPKNVPKGKRVRKTKKMASLPLSRASSGSSSDSEDESESDRTMLASCSLQEIRQEDLAAILPDQQECDAFGGFDCRADKDSPNTGDGSGSDMELPQQAVNALIQRTTESSSESESRLPLNPNTLYANSLLQQFVAQTQMLNAPCSGSTSILEPSITTPLLISTENTNTSCEPVSLKRKRGRPRKNTSNKATASENKLTKTEGASNSILNLDYCGNPNVSPDSGIQNSSDHISSPEPSPNPNSKSKFNKGDPTTSKQANENHVKSEKSGKTQTQHSKLPITSNSLDRMLYANTDRVLYPPRRKKGRPPIIRKGPGRPPKYKSSIANISETKPIKKESENSGKLVSDPLKSIGKSTVKIETKNIKNKKIKQATNSNENAINVVKKDTSSSSKDVAKKSKSNPLLEVCDKISKRLDLNIINHPVEIKKESNEKNHKINKMLKKSSNFGRVILGNKNKFDSLKVKYTTLKNAKVMHSKHKDKKHKKCKFKFLKPITATIHDPKLNTEIDKLTVDFGKLCTIGLIKQAKENVPDILKVSKKSSKKRKVSEYTERKKKKQNVSSSFNKETNLYEQRLPLKKRHYHLSTNNDTTTDNTHNAAECDTESKIVPASKDLKSSTTVTKVNKITVLEPVVELNTTEIVSKCVTETDSNASKLSSNDYSATAPESVEIHIDEAIEACINKYASPTKLESLKIPSSESIKVVTVSPVKDDKLNTSGSSITTTTTPKKRHRLEQKNNLEEPPFVNGVIQSIVPSSVVITLEDSAKNLKHKMPIENLNSVKKNSTVKTIDNSNQKKVPEKKHETVAQIITRKKNRLEDLTLTLAHKVNSSPVLDAADDTSKRKKEPTKNEDTNTNCNRKLRREDSQSVIKDKQENLKVEETCDNQKRKKICKQDVTEYKSKKESITTKINECLKSQKENKSNDTISKKDSSKASEIVNENIKRKKDTLKCEDQLISRVSVIKSPISKRAKILDPEKMDTITQEQPTGIFMPTIDIELHIPSSTIPNSHAINKTNQENLERYKKLQESTCEESSTSNVSVIKNEIVKESTTTLRKRIRKRRTINRTGFPTVKKKKKKVMMDISEMKVEDKVTCDRVPQEGEKYSAFLKRTEKLNVSNTILEKLQNSISSNERDSIPSYDSESEEESMYELGVSKSGRCLSRQTCRSKDTSPDGSYYESSTRSDERDSDLEELSLEARLQLQKSELTNGEFGISKYKRNEKGLLRKNGSRDFSPASSEKSDKRGNDEILVSGDEKRNKRIPRWRKRYLIAGLFSDYYKEDDEAVRLRRTEAATKSKNIVYKPAEHPYGLLPAPYHCGKYLRCRKIPFQLPHDLWWQHTHSQLPGRDIVPSWNYRKIRSNVYNIKVTTGACEPQSCNCTAASDCGDDCINRLVLAECPATHKCQNQRIQKHDWAPGIEKFMTTDKGWGIRTKLPIKTGEFILEYIGEVVSDHEFKERMASRYAHDIHHYCLHLDGGLVIDGHRMGGEGRFVNHSCEPNCEMQKWSVNGQFRMALFALRDIEGGEELTYDYNFSLFNPAEGQECKCGSKNCRGVIGGKSQRVRQSISSSSTSNQVGRVGRPRKNQAKRTTSCIKEVPVTPAPPPIAPTPPMKPLNHMQKVFIRNHHCFMIRNLNKAKHNRDRSLDPLSLDRTSASTPTTDHNATTLINHLNALRQPRNMKTRRLAQAEDNPEFKKVAQLAGVLKDIFNLVTSAKDEKGELLCSSFMNLPSKRKLPEYYQKILEPIDFSTIEQNISMGVYRAVEFFDEDMNKIFNNAVRFFGRTSELGIAATRLKKIYGDTKQQNLGKLEEVLGEKLPLKFIANKRKGDEEDVIRCICGMYRDEGLMIQCERCLVWQHCECVRADPAAASYHCERCVPREVDYEIALDEYTEHGHRYYMTLMRGDLQLKQGDTVYVLRDIAIPGTSNKHTYKTIGKIKYTDLDIFRIERLWKDSKNGQRFAYGHHYLRPHETFHEPTRKFFPNEVMRVPLYEAVPVELVISHCWVMDINTFCKGRPLGAPEEHIYICEYRVDKSARLFSKISKAKYPICTKSYAFDRFDIRIKVTRTYTPHDLDPAFVKPRGRQPQKAEEVREIPPMPVHVPVVRTLSEKKTRLNKILLILLNKMSTKQALDVSYLLEGGRRRKKQTEKC